MLYILQPLSVNAMGVKMHHDTKPWRCSSWNCAIHFVVISILWIMHLMQLDCLNTRGPTLRNILHSRCSTATSLNDMGSLPDSTTLLQNMTQRISCAMIYTWTLRHCYTSPILKNQPWNEKREEKWETLENFVNGYKISISSNIQYWALRASSLDVD